MIRVTVTPRSRTKIYSLMVKKEVELRKKKQGTLHRWAPKKSGDEKWVHNTYPGWIRFKDTLGGVAVALVGSKSDEGETQLLSSLLGFLDRHFRGQVANINITYEMEE